MGRQSTTLWMKPVSYTHLDVYKRQLHQVVEDGSLVAAESLMQKRIQWQVLAAKGYVIAHAVQQKYRCR